MDKELNETELSQTEKSIISVLAISWSARGKKVN